ncbi:hypothetical protein TNCT_219631 [Trichonephila clavata]|uniref:Uncharacterized protein n=1 Tax=Trichonephila clavata TaxID=2740835 RepID=A0A8X6F1S9_TRICU|nr:hypothetical protein TNCT_219631 [Trichonephila clavata]
MVSFSLTSSNEQGWFRTRTLVSLTIQNKLQSRRRRFGSSVRRSTGNPTAIGSGFFKLCFIVVALSRCHSKSNNLTGYIKKHFGTLKEKDSLSWSQMNLEKKRSNYISICP